MAPTNTPSPPSSATPGSRKRSYQQISNSNKNDSEFRKKQRRPPFSYRREEWPAFCDAAATVSASTFGARRLVEIKQLYEQVNKNNASNNTTNNNNQSVVTPTTIINACASGGRKTSKRHLRRRIKSHNSRIHRHRQQQASSSKSTTTTTTGIHTDQERLAMPSLSLSSACRHKQRRHLHNLQLIHWNWWTSRTNEETTIANSNNAGTKSNSCQKEQDRTRPTASHWIITHLWHVKRFHMQKVFGWNVPVVHCNRGPQAAYRLVTETMTSNEDLGCSSCNSNNTSATLLTHKTLIQETTWQQRPIHLRLSNSEPQTMDMAKQILKRTIPSFDWYTTDGGSGATNACDVDASKHTSCFAGDGILYAADTFPLGAIGPISWLHSITTSNTHNNTDKESNDTSKTENDVLLWCLLVHPAIEDEARDIMNDLLTAASNKAIQLAQPNTTTGGMNHMAMASLSLRGPSSVNCLTTALVSMMGGLSVHPALQAGSPDNTSPLSSHGDGADAKEDLSQALAQLGQCHGVGRVVRCHDKSRNASKNNDAETRCRVFVVVKNPCNVSDPCNFGVCGLDIYFDRDHAVDQSASQNVAAPLVIKSLFLACILQGQACPIGLAEHAYLQSQANPPQRVFPRDYPETRHGQTYWTDSNVSGDNEDADNINSNVDKEDRWKIIRAILQGGPNRVMPLKETPLQGGSIDWTSLFVDDANTSSTFADAVSMAMIRGAFGSPLQQAFASFRMDKTDSSGASSVQRQQKVNSKMKLRRPVRQAPFRTLPRLSIEQAKQHKKYCWQLNVSLSLAALVCCEICLLGRGTLEPGDAIVAESVPGGSPTSMGANDEVDEDSNTNEHMLLLLGHVLTGCFSTSRGLVHGVGAVGGNRLVQVIGAAGQQPGSMFTATRSKTHSKGSNSAANDSVWLGVHVVRNYRRTTATNLHPAVLKLLL